MKSAATSNANTGLVLVLQLWKKQFEGIFMEYYNSYQH